MDNLDTLRKGARYGAYGMSIASAALTGFFAASQSDYWIISAALVAFLVICSLASDYIGLFVVDAWRSRNWQAMSILGCGLAVAVTLNLMSNVGSVGWQRATTITEAKVHNVKVDDSRKQIADAEQAIALKTKELSDLHAKHGWITTVDAKGLAARLDSANLAIEQEAKRGGCGPKCLALTKERDELQARIATAERRDRIAQDMENLRTELGVLRAKAKGNVVKVAAADSQASFFGSLITASLTPSQDAKTWTLYGINTWLAFGLVFLPIVLAFAGFKTDSNVSQRTVSRETQSRETFSGKIEPLTPDPAAAPMGFLGGNTNINIHDEDGRKILEAIRAYASNKAITA